MKIAHLDCNAGISGNMFLGALLYAGLPAEILKTELNRLKITVPTLEILPVIKNGISATYFEVAHSHEHTHRHLSDITELISKAGYSERITKLALKCFTELAKAEAKIHGIAMDEVHFHEVGAIDAIIDIIGACIGLEYLQIEQITCSPIRVGFGTVQCAHGEIPLPAPATMELLQGFQVFGGDIAGEWTTPTGATILRSLTKGNDELPLMQQECVGYGAGKADRSIPNVLRMFVGTVKTKNLDSDEQIVIETNIDDMNPEIYGYLGTKLFEAGARDVYFTPIFMKKGRPAVLVSVISPPSKVNTIENIIFSETTTLGVRKYAVQRSCLKREEQIVELSGHEVRIKVGIYSNDNLKFAPEYEDCVAAAKQLNRPLKDIYNEANYQARKFFNK